MLDVQKIKIDDYDYFLPNDRIASFPLEERDASRLLIYKSGLIMEDEFKQLANHLPSSSQIIFNNSKVVHARLLFNKQTGGDRDFLPRTCHYRQGYAGCFTVNPYYQVEMPGWRS